MEKKLDSKTLRLFYKLLLGIAALILVVTVVYDWLSAKPLPNMVPLSTVFVALVANALKELAKKREEEENAKPKQAARKKK